MSNIWPHCHVFLTANLRLQSHKLISDFFVINKNNEGRILFHKGLMHWVVQETFCWPCQGTVTAVVARCLRVCGRVFACLIWVWCYSLFILCLECEWGLTVPSSLVLGGWGPCSPVPSNVVCVSPQTCFQLFWQNNEQPNLTSTYAGQHTWPVLMLARDQYLCWSVQHTQLQFDLWLQVLAICPKELSCY